VRKGILGLQSKIFILMDAPSATEPRRFDSPPRTPRRPWTRSAWGVIVLVCVGWIALSSMKSSDAPSDTASDVAPTLGMQDNLLGRIVVGLDVVFNDPALSAQFESEAHPLRDGTDVQRLAWVILQARLHGAQTGIDTLDALDLGLDEDEALVRSALAIAEDGGALGEDERAMLIARFDYFGKVLIGLTDSTFAASINREAMRGAIALIVVVCIFGIAGLAGFVGLVIMLMLALTRPRPPTETIAYHGLYAETFAVWLVVFFGLQLAVAFSDVLPMMIGNTLAFFVSLAALGWPCLRGVTWKQVRCDVGLSTPKNKVFEPLLGLGAWGMALPFMGAGLVLTFILTAIAQALTGEAPQASHPVQQEAIGAGFGQVVMLYIVACVAAPIVEETFFRGVLYTHLRAASARWGFWLSIAGSMLLSAFVFAAIHPQGLLFAPPLMGLAVGFAIAREWRGSLIASMVAHGVNNALVMTLNVILFA
jgi:membrane protease YdiL (CAAX protease family)